MLAAAARIGIASVVAMLFVALVPARASASGEACAGGVSRAGVEAGSRRRFDGVQARLTTQGALAERAHASDGLAVVVAIGDLRATYIAVMFSAEGGP